MIGAYQGSSGAEAALKSVVDAMVFPGNLDVSLQWPVFLGQPSGLRVSYQRRDSEYEIGQTYRLLEVNELIFDIFIFTANEHEALDFTDGLEGGFNTFPLPAGLQAVRDQLAGLQGAGTPHAKAGPAVERIMSLLGRSGTITVDEQEKKLRRVNRALADISTGAATADWSDISDDLEAIQARIARVPPYAFRPLGCRDLTAPEIWQLGISGRVYSVAMEYTATEWT